MTHVMKAYHDLLFDGVARFGNGGLGTCRRSRRSLSLRRSGPSCSRGSGTPSQRKYDDGPGAVDRRADA